MMGDIIRESKVIVIGFSLVEVMGGGCMSMLFSSHSKRM